MKGPKFRDADYLFKVYEHMSVATNTAPACQTV